MRNELWVWLRRVRKELLSSRPGGKELQSSGDPCHIQPWWRAYFGDTARSCCQFSRDTGGGGRRTEEWRNRREKEKRGEEEEEEQGEVAAAYVEFLLIWQLPYLRKPKFVSQENQGGIGQEKTDECSVCSSAEYTIGSLFMLWELIRKFSAGPKLLRILPFPPKHLWDWC